MEGEGTIEPPDKLQEEQSNFTEDSKLEMDLQVEPDQPVLPSESEVTDATDVDGNDDTATIDTNSDTIEASPIPSIKSLGSGDFEEPLTPVTDVSSKSETSRSQAGSGRVTPGSQSDHSVSMSSSEKSTPNKKRKSTDTAGKQIDFDGQPSRSASNSRLAARYPFRAGIQWKKGEKLEAMDFMHKWFPAKIREIDPSNLSVLIHFDGWNQRFDEWVEMASDRIRPLIRHSERKERGKRLKGDYKIGEQVYAKWTDCKMYPAKITAVMPNGSYEVIFYDGFKKQVQPINLRPMPGELKKKTFEINPVPAEVIKKAKIKKEHIEISTPDIHSDSSKSESAEKRRSSEKGSGEKKSSRSKSKKIKMIPADLFKQSSREVEEPDSSPSIKSEAASTQTAYHEKLEMGIIDDIKKEIVTTTNLGLYVDPALTIPSTPSMGVIPGTSYGTPVLPPKAFVVESDHNRYKCHFEGCNKGFRKEHLLEYHNKYYHIDGAAGPPPPQPSRKRRKTTSSTDSESTSTGKKSGFKQRRQYSADAGLVREIKVEGLDEMNSPVTQSTMPETGEISTQTTPVKSSDQSTIEETYQIIKEELGTKHQRSQSQESNWTEDSSVTDLEGEDSLKPDELVNCICDFYEENGLMIQCEVCMCWQHAGCFGITERTLPKTYVCFVCENPPGVRESAKHIHEQDWLKNGEIPYFTYLQTSPASEERRNIIKATNSLVTDLHHLNTVLHSMKLQLKILRTKDEQKLKMWRMDWDVMEPFEDSRDNPEEVPDNNVPVKEEISDHPSNDNLMQSGAEVKTEEAIPVVKTEPGIEIKMEPDDVYLKSKDEIKTEAIDASQSETNERIVIELGQLKKNMPCSNEIKQEVKANTNTESVQQQVGDVMKEPEMKVTPDEPLQLSRDGQGTNITSNGSTSYKRQSDVAESRDELNNSADQMKVEQVNEEKVSFDVELEEANHSDSTESAVEDPLEMCEKNLLNHIVRVQEEINSRMDQIEEQIALLEAVEAARINKEPPTPETILSDMPQLKRCMKIMHDDLLKVKKMSVFH